MESIYRDLFIGTVGSVFGALIVYFGGYGLNVTKKARKTYAERLQKEKALWNTGEIQVRMEITNNYLFAILKDFLLGSIFTVVPTAIGYAAGIMVFSANAPFLRLLNIINLSLAVVILLGLVYYFSALGKTLRYLRIQRDDEDYLETCLDPTTHL